MMLARSRRVLPVHYAWVIAGVTFLALLASAGVRATGQLVFLPQQAAIVETTGWRPAVLLAAGVAVFVAVLVALFMRNDPRQIGLQPYGIEDDPQAGAGSAPMRGNAFALAITTLVD